MRLSTILNPESSIAIRVTQVLLTNYRGSCQNQYAQRGRLKYRYCPCANHLPQKNKTSHKFQEDHFQSEKSFFLQSHPLKKMLLNLENQEKQWKQLQKPEATHLLCDAQHTLLESYSALT